MQTVTSQVEKCSKYDDNAKDRASISKANVFHFTHIFLLYLYLFVQFEMQQTSAKCDTYGQN